MRCSSAPAPRFRLLAGAEQETVVADIAPAPAPEVLARLLNGSRFNFLILSAPNDPGKLDRVILSTRAEGAIMALPPMEVQDPTPAEDASAAPAQNNPPPLPNPASPPEIKAPQPDNNAPN